MSPELEAALLELEAAARYWVEESSKEPLYAAIDALAAIRAKEEQERTLYAAHYLPDTSYLGHLGSVTYHKNMQVHNGTLQALFPYRDGRFTGERIDGEELAELLEGP